MKRARARFLHDAFTREEVNPDDSVEYLDRRKSTRREPQTPCTLAFALGFLIPPSIFFFSFYTGPWIHWLFTDSPGHGSFLSQPLTQGAFSIFFSVLRAISNGSNIMLDRYDVHRRSTIAKQRRCKNPLDSSFVIDNKLIINTTGSIWRQRMVGSLENAISITTRTKVLIAARERRRGISWCVYTLPITIDTTNVVVIVVLRDSSLVRNICRVPWIKTVPSLARGCANQSD